MKLMLIHFFTTILIMGIGLFVGRIMEKTKQMKNGDFKIDRMLEELKQKPQCETCIDYLPNHPFCLKCCYTTIRNLRFIVPSEVWLMGAESYDWAKHFEIEYREQHAIHVGTHVSITCPRCHATSYNLRDVENKYCVRCNRFHDEINIFEEQSKKLNERHTKFF